MIGAKQSTCIFWFIYYENKKTETTSSDWFWKSFTCIIGGNIKRLKQPKVIGSKKHKNLHVLLKGDLYYLICILCAQEDSNKKQRLILKIIYICITGKQIHQYSMFSLCALKEWCQQAGSEDHLQYLQKNSLSICTQKDSNNQWWLVLKIIYMYEYIYTFERKL